MSRHVANQRARQRGLVLVSSLLLLLVVTILALAMFRNMGLGERISGNLREKTRALHAAVVAEQYAEWWLSNGTASLAPQSCNATGNANVGVNQVMVCSTPLPAPTTLPWIGSGGGQVGISYYPNAGSSSLTTMSFGADASGSNANMYAAAPTFYIAYMGSGNDKAGLVYKIDAVGFGTNKLSVAVVESTYEIGSSVTNLGVL
jgi:type IV pilus assembly protein PilX